MKVMLYGEADQDPKPENIEKLVQELLNENVPVVLLENIAKFHFEVWMGLNRIEEDETIGDL